MKDLEVGEDHVGVEDVLRASEHGGEDGVEDGARGEVAQSIRHPPGSPVVSPALHRTATHLYTQFTLQYTAVLHEPRLST